MPAMTALLSVPAAAFIDAIRARAALLEAAVVEVANGVRVLALSGQVEALAAPGSLQVTVDATDAEMAAFLRREVEAFLAAEGQSAPDWQPVTGLAPRARLTLAQVVSVRRISPSFTRVRLAGDFTAFQAGGLHFRLLLGPPGAAEPTAGPDGIDWPGGIDAWHRPPYTIRAMDPGAAWVDFDVFRHEGGRVTEWCDDVRPGARILLTGPGGKGVRQAGWLGLVGDETALPVILRAIAAAGPQTLGRAILIVPDAADVQPVDTPPGLRLDWVIRGPETGALDLLRSLEVPEADRFLFFAGERAEAQAARDHAKSLGLAAGEFLAAAYWTAGWVPPPEQRQARSSGR